MPRARFALVACLALSAARIALAADDDPVEAARQRFRQGVALFEKGDLAGALEQFQQADKIRHAPPITYNIARVHEGLGRAQSAVDAYEAYLAEAGPGGEFSSAATVAIAQIKAHTTRLRVETDPPGAVVRVDGVALADKTPAIVLLSRGRHRISVEASGWNDGRDFDAAGDGGSDVARLVRPKEQKAAAPAPAPAAMPARKPPELKGMTGGAGVALFYYRFLSRAEGADSQVTYSSKASGVVFGLSFEVGHAVSSKTAVMLRGFGGLGSSEKALAWLGEAGLMATTRATRSLWLGGGGIVGASQADSGATQQMGGVTTDASVTYRTRLAGGPMLEIGLALGENEDGQWLISTYPSLLISGSGQSSIFLPLVVGHRWF